MIVPTRFWVISVPFWGLRDPLLRDIGQTGSLAGAAYLLNDNAGVLNLTQWEQKSHVAHKGKSQAELLIFSTNPDCESKA